jgi:excisionase family DNA binding protein
VVVTDRLLTAREVAEWLGLSSSTVLDWFEAGRLPGFRLGRVGGPVRFRQDEIDVWIEGRRVQSGRLAADRVEA